MYSDMVKINLKSLQFNVASGLLSMIIWCLELQ